MCWLQKAIKMIITKVMRKTFGQLGGSENKQDFLKLYSTLYTLI